MRDVKRIKPFLNEVAKLWEQHQDLRFGQFIYWLLDKAQKSELSDLFFWEEDQWLEILEKISKNS